MRSGVSATLVMGTLLFCVLQAACAQDRLISTSCSADSSCMRRQIDAAVSQLVAKPDQDVVLRFSAGTHLLSGSDRAGLAVVASTPPSGRGFLVLAGQGMDSTTLAVKDREQEGIRIARSQRVRIQDLHLTRVDGSGRTAMFTTQGRVVRRGNEVFFVTESGFPDPLAIAAVRGAEDREITLIEFTDSALEPRLAPGARKIKLDRTRPFLACDGRSGCPDGGLRVNLDSRSAAVDAALLREGGRYALKAKAGARSILLANCQQCEVRKVRITGASGAAIAAIGASDQLVVDKVVIEPPAPIGGIRPFFSGPGGGIVLESTRRGPVVTGSTVIGTADDGIAVFSEDALRPMSGALIRGNRIRDNQARGILITQSIDGEVVDNIVERSSEANLMFRFNEKARGKDRIKLEGWRVYRNRLVPNTRSAAIGFSDECSGKCGQIAALAVEDNLIEFQAGAEVDAVDLGTALAPDRPVTFQRNQLRVPAGTVNRPLFDPGDLTVRGLRVIQ